MSSAESNFDGELSLEDIEQDRWSGPPVDASSLVARVHELRRMPVSSLGVEELRVLLSQQVGVDALTPLALARLGEEPLAEGDYYPGDLLVAVLRLPEEYWSIHPDHAGLLTAIVSSVDDKDVNFPVGTELPKLIAAIGAR